MRLYSILAILAALGTPAVAADPPKLPAPYHTPSSSNGPKVVARPDGATLRVPAGFSIEEFATGFERPRFMIYGPTGEILLSDSGKAGSVYALADTNKNGKIEDTEKTKLIGDLDRPYGLAIWKDYLYIAETTSLKRYKYDSKARKLGPAEELVPLKDADKGHWTRSILFDAKGEKRKERVQ